MKRMSYSESHDGARDRQKEKDYLDHDKIEQFC